VHDLNDIPGEEIQKESESQGVVIVKRFTEKKNIGMKILNSNIPLE
jgi:hypothetical protein